MIALRSADVNEKERVGIPSMIRPCFAVDIDNVLGRAEPEVQRLFQELTGTSWPVGLYGSAGGLDTSLLERELIEEIFSRFHEESIPRLPALPGAKQALAVIHRRYRIIIVTARRPHSRPQTLQWLVSHGIPFDALYHTEEKNEIPESVTAAIDDHPHHIQGYRALGMQVFVMDQPWNRELEHADVIRVTGWDALLQWLHVRQAGHWPTRIPEYPSPQQLFSSHLKKTSTPVAGIRLGCTNKRA
jgi:5'(3')-deoxyribonucleotidase